MKNSIKWFNTTSIPVRFSKVTNACEPGPDLCVVQVDCAGPVFLRCHVFLQLILELLHDNSIIFRQDNDPRFQLHSCEFWHQERVETWDLKVYGFAFGEPGIEKRVHAKAVRRILMNFDDFISSIPLRISPTISLWQWACSLARRVRIEH